MKLIFKYIILGALVCGLSACSEKEFLDVKPQGSLNDAVLTSAEGVTYLVNSSYSALAGPNTTFGAMGSPVNHWLSGELHADNAYKGGGGPSDNPGFHNLETYVVTATHSSMNNWWQSLYQSIKRTNNTLAVLNTCTPEDVPDLEVLKAEMRTLRAHFYFELSRHFNKIVWIDENDVEQEYYSIRNDEYTRDEILGMIAKEFEEVAAILPDKQDDKGRANKYIAYAYAAKVYLYKAYRQNPADNSVTSIDQADLAKVLEYTDKVMKSPNGYALFDDYQHLDMVEHENGKESIWAVQYSMNDGFVLSGFLSSTAGHVNWSQLLNTPKGPYSGDDFFKASKDFVNSFQVDANGLPLLDTFQDQAFDDIKVTVDENNNMTYARSRSDALVDPRVDFSVGRLYVRWKTFQDYVVDQKWYRDIPTYGFHIIKRFLVSPDSGYLCTGYPWGGSPLNFQIIRYAHLLLWRAEALIELGRQDEARALINQIRNRAKNSEWVKAWGTVEGDKTDDAVALAGAPNFNGYAANYKIEEYPAAGWTQEYARKALRHETRLEYGLEGERFFDLVRWGIAAETMNRYFEVEKTRTVYYEGVKFVKGKDEYFPIPQTQYNLTKGSYVQNPGYPAF